MSEFVTKSKDGRFKLHKDLLNSLYGVQAIQNSSSYKIKEGSLSLSLRDLLIHKGGIKSE